jgi:uncharacterized membrane protein
MPESRARRKNAFTAPPSKASPPKPNAPWFVPLMLGLLVLGLVWIVVYYLLPDYPIPGIGAFNLAIGFGIMLTGFAMTTRWR